MVTLAVIFSQNGVSDKDILKMCPFAGKAVDGLYRKRRFISRKQDDYIVAPGYGGIHNHQLPCVFTIWAFRLVPAVPALE